MDNKQLQTWLQQLGFYKGKIDGIVGRGTKAALRQAQQYLAGLGLYSKKVDGIYGSGTAKAISIYNSGRRYFNKYGVSLNMYDPATWDRAYNTLRAKGARSLNINGLTFDLTKEHGKHNFMATLGDLRTGRQSTFVGTQSDNRAPQEAQEQGSQPSLGDNIKALRSTARPTNGGGSSYSSDDLDNLVMRYAYDRYHGTAIDNNQWGIRLGSNKFSGQDLTIDSNKYTPEQAARIARGAGFATYRYGGKKYDTNLFAGGQYKDSADFDTQIQALADTKGLQAAQDAYNAELGRQYNTYGIDQLMLKDKSGNQWNNLFGAVPYGYNLSSISAIARGEQALHEGTAQSNSMGTAYPQYRYDPETGHGRFKYNNYDEWYQGRVLANPKYLNMNEGGISGIRATTSTYMAGIPVAAQSRKYIQFVGARPNKSSIDRTNFYTLAGDSRRGKVTMNHNLYTDLTKNPAASFKYLNYIFGGRKKDWRGNWVTTNGRNFKIDPVQANELATAAGLDPRKYHGDKEHFQYNIGSGNTNSHDTYESLQSFYLNGFDENGQLRPDFQYTEPGYAAGYDGGAYTTVIRNNKPVRSEDYWDVSIKGISGGMNAGIGGKGIPLITRYNKQGGLLQYITAFGDGNKFTDNKGRGDKVDTKECAAWSNGTLRGLNYLISGNAWGLNGVDIIFNGYEGLNKPSKYDRTEVQNYNQAAADSVYKNFDSKTLDQSRPYVVNMFYKGSPAQERAYNEGKNVTGTHTGILSYQDGQWVVTHNIHGTIHEEPFISLQNGRGKYGVTAVYKPRRNNLINNIKRVFGLELGGCIMPD